MKERLTFTFLPLLIFTAPILYVRYLLETTDGTATGTAQILVNGEGQNMIIIIAGANGHLIPVDVRKAEDVIAQAAVLTVRLSTYVLLIFPHLILSKHTHEHT